MGNYFLCTPVSFVAKVSLVFNKLMRSNLCIFVLGAIQIIRDTLGGRGGVSKNVTGQFLLGISLVKVDKKCHIEGGRGV